MQKAEKGDKVKVHYSGTLKDGTEFDSSEGKPPLEFVLGEGRVIPGFEKAVEGMAVDETRTVAISAVDAYGPYNEQMIIEVERDQFPSDVPLTVGQHYQFDTNKGEVHIVRVIEMDDRLVTLDANHPLAGEDLAFEIRLVEIGD